MKFLGRVLREESFSHNGVDYEIKVIHQDAGWYSGVAVHNGTAVVSILVNLDDPSSGMTVESLMDQVRSEIRKP